MPRVKSARLQKRNFIASGILGRGKHVVKTDLKGYSNDHSMANKLIGMVEGFTAKTANLSEISGILCVVTASKLVK